MMIKFLAALFFCVSLVAAPKFRPGIMNAEDGGFDYLVQGEYKSAEYGVQLIALGNDYFQAVIYRGGLPGDSWNGLDKWILDGLKNADLVEFKKTQNKKVYMGGRNSFSATEEGIQPDWKAIADGKQFKLLIKEEEYVLKKIFRQSPTLAQQPPSGAKVLLPFKEGQSPDLQHWDNPHWKALKDGSMLVIVPEKRELKFSTCGIQFGDKSYHLHLEFKTSFMPESRSQARANSGVFPPNGYEVQVLDSFGLEGKNNEAGGIYKKAAPALNMCYPPLTWQTYDIYFHKVENGQDNFYRILHNGVEIHKKLPVKKVQAGSLRLQDHLNSIFFRNIWVKETE